MRCRICGETRGKTYRAREMMFGLRDTFSYFECAGCGCVQLVDVPEDMTRYYPAEYYSYADVTPPPPPRGGRLRLWAAGRRNEAQLFRRGGLWQLVARCWPRPDLGFFRHLRLGGWDARILDVGCGSGKLLRKLAHLGFHDLWGVDPFLKADLDLGPNLHIRAQPLDSLPSRHFDLVMFHHSLEHMPAQVETLRTVARLLRPGGACLVRLPIASCEAWRLFGTDWVELDAPRHFFLHTPQSLAVAARQAGLEIYHQGYDLVSLPYWGSELYRRGVTLVDPQRGGLRAPLSVFSAVELADFEQRAARAIRKKRGGPGVFYLRRGA